MNVELDDLRAFVVTAEMRSFRAAAENIHLSQPALTRRIQKLEATLGVPRAALLGVGDEG